MKSAVAETLDDTFAFSSRRSHCTGKMKPRGSHRCPEASHENLLNQDERGGENRRLTALTCDINIVSPHELALQEF
jgi:hypothetical protein